MQIFNPSGVNFYFKKLVIYFWLYWVFTAVLRLSLAAASRAVSLVVVCRLLSVVWSMGSGVVAHGSSCPMVCGIFLDQGFNLFPLNWQVDSGASGKSELIFIYGVR